MLRRYRENLIHFVGMSGGREIELDPAVPTHSLIHRLDHGVFHGQSGVNQHAPTFWIPCTLPTGIEISRPMYSTVENHDVVFNPVRASRRITSGRPRDWE